MMPQTPGGGRETAGGAGPIVAAVLPQVNGEGHLLTSFPASRSVSAMTDPLTAPGEGLHPESHDGSGHPEFAFVDGPGDYIFVPPYVPHGEENPDPAEEAVVVIARSTQEAIVVNLPHLYAVSEDD